MNARTSIRFWNAQSRDVAVTWASESALRIATSPGHSSIAVLLHGVHCPRRIEALEGQAKWTCRADNQVVVQMDENAALIDVQGVLPNRSYY